MSAGRKTIHIVMNFFCLCVLKNSLGRKPEESESDRQKRCKLKNKPLTVLVFSGVCVEVQDVIRIGFEPMTYSLEGCRSIQLSYRT